MLLLTHPMSTPRAARALARVFRTLSLAWFHAERGHVKGQCRVAIFVAAEVVPPVAAPEQPADLNGHGALDLEDVARPLIEDLLTVADFNALSLERGLEDPARLGLADQFFDFAHDALGATQRIVPRAAP